MDWRRIWRCERGGLTMEAMVGTAVSALLLAQLAVFYQGQSKLESGTSKAATAVAAGWHVQKDVGDALAGAASSDVVIDPEATGVPSVLEVTHRSADRRTLITRRWYQDGEVLLVRTQTETVETGQVQESIKVRAFGLDPTEGVRFRWDESRRLVTVVLTWPEQQRTWTFGIGL